MYISLLNTISSSNLSVKYFKRKERVSAFYSVIQSSAIERSTKMEN